MQDFKKLVHPDRHQVFLFTCPAEIPFNFARHPWFVINNKGVLSRWEIFWHPEDAILRWGHLHQDYYAPFEGIERSLYSKRRFKDVRLGGVVEGSEGSVAQQMAAAIEATPQTYPHRDHYVLRGPNSNTYAQWIINQFPEAQQKMSLPWNAFGKNFK